MPAFNGRASAGVSPRAAPPATPEGVASKKAAQRLQLPGTDYAAEGGVPVEECPSPFPAGLVPIFSEMRTVLQGRDDDIRANYKVGRRGAGRGGRGATLVSPPA